MAGQDQQRTTRRDDTPDEPEALPAPAGQGASQAATEDVDDLLDEIDTVLEENSEEFVRGFVQKGGE